ncbi:MAG: phosphoribosylformylglycinamidine synthase subunit PurQ [Deltaproteobacteria bacterium]|nr:phosphoribosylformylglycinamidine synthase subunit PurQ [Deltaproteobacteria bacterium]
MKFGIIVFPGSNCDHDCYHVVKHVFGQKAEYIWHKDTGLKGFDCLILPGGFSYGDYLRTGAIARFSPVMNEVVSFADKGGLVLGICNGFQVLTEAGLLPGVLMRNRDLKFICKETSVRVENNRTAFTSSYRQGEPVRIPIAHADGNYYADPDTVKALEDNGRVVFRYSTPSGEATPEANPNGSVNNIAGITNSAGNVLGMMPHPERAAESELGSTDGRGVFESIIHAFSGCCEGHDHHGHGQKTHG